MGANNMKDSDVEISVAVVGKRKMKEISDKYLGDGQIHDILSFPLEELDFKEKDNVERGFVNPPGEMLRLGDIILCWPKILEDASREDIFVDEEVYFLTRHGTEHLLGKHHQE